MNSIYNAMQNNRQPNGLVQSFNAFRNAYRGNARAEVEAMLKDGRMTQAQFNDLSQKANELIKYLK